MSSSTSDPKAIRTRRLGRTGLEMPEVGVGTASLGNLYQTYSDEQAEQTLTAALQAGLRYVDTAPFYGYGLAERRVGDAVRGEPGVLISTKVGRLLIPAPQGVDDPSRRHFYSSFPFEPQFDYSYDGIMRSYEHSLQRLGVARVHILFIHDVGTFTHGERHAETFAQLTRQGGLKALEELRSARDIAAYGVGVNETTVCLELMHHARIDIILLAGRYTLLEQAPLDEFFPACARNNVGVVIGGPYNSGILATGTRSAVPLHHDYIAAPPEIIRRVRAIESICDRHHVTLAAAALQFTLAHPQVVSVIPGLDSVERVHETVRLHESVIPQAFWQELRACGILRLDAPTPASSRAL